MPTSTLDEEHPHFEKKKSHFLQCCNLFFHAKVKNTYFHFMGDKYYSETQYKSIFLQYFCIL